MDFHKVSALMASALDSLKVIEAAMELSPQLERTRSNLQRRELDNISQAATAVLREAMLQLKAELEIK